jgi:hypothetical protein
MTEPEYITIVEGPTPEFRPTAELAMYSVFEGPQDTFTALCEMRTLNGPAIVARCQRAWKEGRPVKLDFPDEMRLRKELEVAALRLQDLEQGMILQVWVRQPIPTSSKREGGEDDEDDGLMRG